MVFLVVFVLILVKLIKSLSTSTKRKIFIYSEDIFLSLVSFKKINYWRKIFKFDTPKTLHVHIAATAKILDLNSPTCALVH